MAVSIDWGTLVISVPKADTDLVDIGPPEIRELDIDEFRKTVSALLWGVDGMPFLDAYRNIAPVTVGGVTLARVIEIINGYTIEFEDSQYTVNIVGGNSNISDVKVQNQVSVNTFNSAGLVQLTAADVAEISGGVWDALRAAHTSAGSFGQGVAAVYGDVNGDLTGSVGSVVTGVNVAQLAGSSSAANFLRRSALTMIGGTVDDSVFSPTATQFESSDITDALTSKYVGRLVIFEDTSAQTRAVSDITAYSLIGGKGHFTVTGLPTVPLNGDPFMIV